MQVEVRLNKIITKKIIINNINTKNVFVLLFNLGHLSRTQPQPTCQKVWQNTLKILVNTCTRLQKYRPCGFAFVVIFKHFKQKNKDFHQNCEFKWRTVEKVNQKVTILGYQLRNSLFSELKYQNNISKIQELRNSKSPEKQRRKLHRTPSDSKYPYIRISTNTYLRVLR